MYFKYVRVFFLETTDIYSWPSLFCGFQVHGFSQLHIENIALARHQWLVPVILATQEAEIRRNVIGSQPWQIVCKTLSGKNPLQK
jgi:hypothetical protein